MHIDGVMRYFNSSILSVISFCIKKSFFLFIVLLLIGMGSRSPIQVFTENIYKNPRSWDEATNLFQPTARKYFTPDLLTLMQQAQRAPTGEIGLLDFMPLCGCQDQGGMTIKSIALQSFPDHTQASVTLQFDSKQSTTIILSLVQTKGGWRIDDIADKELKIASLKHWIRYWLPREPD